MPVYEWRRKRRDSYEYVTTTGSIHSEVPVPVGDGWERVYNYQVGKVDGAGDSPSRSVKSTP